MQFWTLNHRSDDQAPLLLSIHLFLDPKDQRQESPSSSAAPRANMTCYTYPQ